MLAIVITLAGLASTVIFNLAFVPRWGYFGAAWARFVGEAVMVVVSYTLNRRLYPTPYPLTRIGQYVLLALVLFGASVALGQSTIPMVATYAINALLLSVYVMYAVWREKIDVAGLVGSILKLKR